MLILTIDDVTEDIFSIRLRKFCDKITETRHEKIDELSNWTPKNKPGKLGEEYYKPNRLYYVTNILKINERDAVDFWSSSNF